MDVCDFDEACEAIFALKDSHEAYVQRFSRYAKRSSEWAIYARQDLLTRGHETNNFSEILMRMIKEEVISKHDNSSNN